MKVKKLDLKYNDDLGFKRDKMSKNFAKEICVINPNQASSDVYGSGKTVCIFRFYWGSSVCHCAAWFSGKQHYGSGQGNAGGGGYCKESAAMDEAIENAGITLDRRFGGEGDIAMRTAALAIGKKLTGKHKLILHIAHPQEDEQ